GHYLNKPFEQFTYYVSNTCNKPIDGPHKNPEYTMYEFYNGVNTAIFKLNFQGAAIYGGLCGTFEHIGSDKIYQCDGPFINPNGNSQSFSELPYYNGSINGTLVTLAQTNTQNVFAEKYSNDNNIFTVTKIPMPSQFKNDNYKYALEETFNGNVTGLYLLNINHNTKNLTGIFMHSNNDNFSTNNAVSVNFEQSPLPQVS
ncbi:MAG: hypothetical protein ACRDDY_00565, partial [Clostridium sp.]|uniref:hypothetical protein n=1 Tax=Clostridium sp. TaxID=1506 RepID=UPI003EE658A3